MAAGFQIDPDFQKDYEFFNKDVKKIILNNALVIALLVALYFFNQKFGWLANIERLF